MPIDDKFDSERRRFLVTMGKSGLYVAAASPLIQLVSGCGGETSSDGPSSEELCGEGRIYDPNQRRCLPAGNNNGGGNSRDAGSSLDTAVRDYNNTPDTGTPAPDISEEPVGNGPYTLEPEPFDYGLEIGDINEFSAILKDKNGNVVLDQSRISYRWSSRTLGEEGLYTLNIRPFSPAVCPYGIHSPCPNLSAVVEVLTVSPGTWSDVLIIAEAYESSTYLAQAVFLVAVI